MQQAYKCPTCDATTILTYRPDDGPRCENTECVRFGVTMDDDNG